jgi:hypothetical protein
MSTADANDDIDQSDNEMSHVPPDSAKEGNLMSPAPHDRLHSYMNPSTGVKVNKPNEDGIHVSNHDLGVSSVQNFNLQGPNTSSKKK